MGPRCHKEHLSHTLVFVSLDLVPATVPMQPRGRLFTYIRNRAFESAEARSGIFCLSLSLLDCATYNHRSPQLRASASTDRLSCVEICVHSDHEGTRIIICIVVCLFFNSSDMKTLRIASPIRHIAIPTEQMHSIRCRCSCNVFNIFVCFCVIYLFYHILTRRTLAEMGNFLEKPITDKLSHEGESNGLRYAASSMQGWRTEMEVCHLSMICSIMTFVLR